MFEGPARVSKVRCITTGGNYNVGAWQALVTPTEVTYDAASRSVTAKSPAGSTGMPARQERTLYTIPEATALHAGLMPASHYELLSNGVVAGGDDTQGIYTSASGSRLTLKIRNGSGIEFKGNKLCVKDYDKIVNDISDNAQSIGDMSEQVGQIRQDVSTLQETAVSLEQNVGEVSGQVEVVAQGLQSKQDRFTTSDDLDMSEERVLSLTEMAKKRLFIDMWNTACGNMGTYNENTGYFALNGLTDITYEQAKHIYNAKHIGAISTYGMTSRWYGNNNIRTNLVSGSNVSVEAYNYAFYSCRNLEVANAPMLASGTAIVYGCIKLRKLSMYCINTKASNFTLVNCPKLEEIVGFRFSNFPNNKSFYVSVKDSPLINYATWAYLVDNLTYTLTDVIQVIVHPDVYAKLTGDTTNEAAAALSEEELAQWMALMEQAAEKNIQFATV